MKKALAKFTAYHGKGWKPNLYKKTKFSSTEFSNLREVLLYIPGKELDLIKDPNSVQHLEKIDRPKIKDEFKKIISSFERQGVKVNCIARKLFKGPPPPNLMFARDLFWIGPEGAIVSRMGSEVRSPEEKYISATLALLKKNITLSIHHKGLFEGADLLWLNSKTLLMGVGNRSNMVALKQIEFILRPYKINIVPIKLPKKVQHLLGIMQIVANKKVLIRYQVAPRKLISLLVKEKFEIIKIGEIKEVTHFQGMNIVVIRANEIFMPNDCPNLKKVYQTHGIKILEELQISEIRKAAGGLACICGVLSRKS